MERQSLRLSAFGEIFAEASYTILIAVVRLFCKNWEMCDIMHGSLVCARVVYWFYESSLGLVVAFLNKLWVFSI